jgi:hypothetical protein
MKSNNIDELEYSQHSLKKTNAYRLPDICEYVEEYTIKDKNYHGQPVSISCDVLDKDDKQKTGFFEKSYRYIRNKFFRKKNISFNWYI